jgi:two-component system response regulator DegU
MKSNKILVAIAEDKQEDINIIKRAFSKLSQYQIIVVATSGKELIVKLKKATKVPDLILMDMQMPSGDGLITSITTNTLFQNIKIVGLSSHTHEPLITQFMAEGGSGFLSKFIVQSEAGPSKLTYNDPNIFEKALDQIMFENKIYFDPLCHYKNADYEKINSTKKIVSKEYPFLEKEQILLLQLNAMTFTQKEMARIMNLSVVTLKRHISELLKIFQVQNHIELMNVTFSLGIVKLAIFYQDFY